MAADQLNSNRRRGSPGWISGWPAGNRNAPVGINVQFLPTRTLGKAACAGERDPAKIYRNCAGGAVSRVRTERLRAAIRLGAGAGRSAAHLHLDRESAGKDSLGAGRERNERQNTGDCRGQSTDAQAVCSKSQLPRLRQI